MIRRFTHWSLLSIPLAVVLPGCGSSDPSTASTTSDDVGLGEEIGANEDALVVDDLAIAFGRFRTEFEELGRDEAFDVGLGPLAAFGTENLGRASVILSFEKSGDTYTGLFGLQRGPLLELPTHLNFDLYVGRNVPGTGRSARPESGDHFVKIGTLAGATGLFTNFGVNLKNTGAVDFLLLTRANAQPSSGGVAIGNLSLFEKRFFASKFGWTLPVPSPHVGAAVASNDPFVQQGFRVFFDETFGGNGRTCGTCHRAENNFTIDAAFIATLPANDPLFRAALTVPGLEGLDPAFPLEQIQNDGLILENLDGPERAPVFRSVQHTLGLTATTTRPRSNSITGQEPESPPDERTGWGGDGAPGRGTLHDFAVGAIVQHLTKNAARRTGTDFRLPTQEELDVLEAFQLSLGRSRELDVRALGFAEPAANAGRDFFNSRGLCFVCHANAGARSNGPAIFNNVNLDQGVERRPETALLGLTPDGGFGQAPLSNPDGSSRGFGNGEFNVQSLVEAADTAPFFHNNSAATLEDAIRHYTTLAFEENPAGFATGVRPDLDESQVRDIGAFLRVLNAASNVSEVKKKLAFVRDHSGPGNAGLLAQALADVNDALEVLAQPGRQLSPGSKHALETLKMIVQLAIAQPTSGQPAYANIGLTWCQSFFDLTFTANPKQDFVAD